MLKLYRRPSTRKTEIFASVRNSHRTLQLAAEKHSLLSKCQFTISREHNNNYPFHFNVKGMSREFFRFMRQLLKLSSKREDHIFIWFQTPHFIQHFFHMTFLSRENMSPTNWPPQLCDFVAPESKGRIDHCLRSGTMTLNEKAGYVHSKRKSKKPCVNGVTGQMMRLKYGRERAKFALKKREAQAKQSMCTVSDTIIFWDFWICVRGRLHIPGVSNWVEKKPLKKCDLSLKRPWKERSQVCINHGYRGVFVPAGSGMWSIILLRS